MCISGQTAGTIEEQMTLLTCTVFLILFEGPGYSGEYKSVRKRELINVDFPSPDSPERGREGDRERSRKREKGREVQRFFEMCISR